jgi:hypothetical protein
MGKARRKLAAARKECFDKINHKDEPEKDNPGEYFANIKQKGVEYDEESVYLLQQELFKYCYDGSFPLCEFLDKQNTINYIKHVIKK